MAKLYFRYGAMGSGKTTALLQVAHNYEERHMPVLLIKPEIDTKGDDTVISRIGISRQVDLILPKDKLLLDKGLPLKDLRKPWAIIIDEAQFLNTQQVDELYMVTKKYDIPVLCYGLRCDFQMNGFEGSTRLLQIADDIEELKTICKCGKKATQNLRKVNGEPVFDGQQIAIDNNDKIEYESICGECYLRLRNKL